MKKIIFFFLIILIVFSNTRTSFAADTTKYYFTWQDTAGGYKIEREIIGKDACEAERNSGEYPVTTACYTTSKQAEIDAFNKSSVNFKFTWQMDNFISKQVRKGGGNTSILCDLDRTGKIADLDNNQLKNWKNTKLCTDLGGAVDPYYFNWQDSTTQMKSEVSFVNKKDCEAEQINKKYTNTTACYTPSKQAEVQAFNQARVVDGQTEKNFEEDYTLLAPIGDTTKIDGTTKVGDYLNTLLLIAIGLCGALAVIMIVIYGVQYMGDESVFGKTEAKSHIVAAIMGLLLALGAYAILNTINPNLVGGTLTFNQVDIELEGDSNAPIAGTNLLPSGIVCSGGVSNIPNIARSFNGKMTYSQNIPKGQAGPNNTIKLDCSGYVNYVLKCAGATFINSGTDIIFKDAEKVTDASKITPTKINGVDLKIGDLIGWRPLNDKKGNGHVMIYIGNGIVADSHSPKNLPGKAYGSFSVEKYKDRIKYVKRL